jgi:hypothetical protein
MFVSGHFQILKTTHKILTRLPANPTPWLSAIKAMSQEKEPPTRTTRVKSWPTEHTGLHIQWSLQRIEHNRDNGTVTEYWDGVFLPAKAVEAMKKQMATTAKAAMKKAKAAMKKKKTALKAMKAKKAMKAMKAKK